MHLNIKISLICKVIIRICPVRSLIRDLGITAYIVSAPCLTASNSFKSRKKEFIVKSFPTIRMVLPLD